MLWRTREQLGLGGHLRVHLHADHDLPIAVAPEIKLLFLLESLPDVEALMRLALSRCGVMEPLLEHCAPVGRGGSVARCSYMRRTRSQRITSRMLMPAAAT